MTTYPVVLAANLSKEVGHVWRNEQGLWEGYSLAFNAGCGPFASRIDASAEVVEMWERSFSLNYYRI